MRLPAALTEATVPPASIVVALVVLGLAAYATARIARRSRQEGRHYRSVELVGPSTTTLGADQAWRIGPGFAHRPAAFLVALGRAMIDSGASVTQTQTTLRRVARVNGLHVEVVALPTALFVSIPGREDIQTSLSSAGTSLRLDQVDAVFRVVDAAERGEIDPQRGVDALSTARTVASPYPLRLRLLGHPLLAAGLVLILRGGWLELLVAMAAATAVGALQLRQSRVPAAYSVFLPVVSAFAVSAGCFLVVRAGLTFEAFVPIIAALVTFLPGAALTTAVIELATGQMMSGAGRLAQGGMHLILLAVGILAAAQLVGIPAAGFAENSPSGPESLATWGGVALFGLGVALAYSALPSSLPWIWLILYVAYAAQVLGGLLVGSELSAFIGALVMTPVAMLAAAVRSGPPTLVTFLPAFWLLVPGAVGLAGVTKYLGDARFSGVTTLVTAGGTMVGIALGVLLGMAAGSLVGLQSGIAVDDGPEVPPAQAIRPDPT